MSRLRPSSHPPTTILAASTTLSHHVVSSVSHFGVSDRIKLVCHLVLVTYQRVLGYYFNFCNSAFYIWCSYVVSNVFSELSQRGLASHHHHRCQCQECQSRRLHSPLQTDFLLTYLPFQAYLPFLLHPSFYP